MKSKSREKYEASRTGTFLTYAAQKGDAFEKRIDLLTRLIHGKHEPSLGGYKERLLADALRQSIPKKYEVGTGFVAFPGAKMDSSKSSIHEISRQLDVIVFDSHDFAPVFRDGDFVVVPPRAVRAVIEVKSTASYKSLRDVVEWAIDFGAKWSRCCDVYSEMISKPPRPPMLLAMFWDVYVNTDGKQEITPKNFPGRIRDIYNELIKPPIPKKFPLLNLASIYSKATAGITGYVKDDKAWMGWATYRGQFVKKKDETYLEVGDRTIADIVARVLVGLSTPFDQFFAYFDDDNSIEATSHPDGVCADWLPGDQIETLLIDDDSFE
jgi:hypothetical protein